ncbi:MAG: hypothetical protein ACTSYU_00925, partial [Promethearchaeota archaeon]
CCVVAADNTFLSENSEIAEKVIRAHIDATKWIHNNPQEAIELAMEKMNLTEDQAILAIANIGFVYMPDLGKMVEFIDKMVELNDAVELDSEFIPSGLTSTTFIDYFVDTSIVSSLAGK